VIPRAKDLSDTSYSYAAKVDMLKNGALTGKTVLDLSRMLPGPYCSMILADHGARVIAVEDERFTRDPFFVSALYRNKEHMTLNLKNQVGREIFSRLVRQADVLIEGFRPGVTARLGVDYPSMQEINPRLVYCSLTGYGQSGPQRDRAGHDVNYLAAAGVLDLIGVKEGPPVIPGIQIADLAGGMNAVIGILLALLAREQSGCGQFVDISMSEAALGLLPFVLNQYNQGGSRPVRGDFILSHRYACYNTYQTADGRALSVGALEPKFWAGLCTHLGVEEYIDHQFDDSRRQEIINALGHIFSQKTLAQWEEELMSLDVCCERVRNLEEAMADQQFRDRGMALDFPDQDGREVPSLGVVAGLDGTPGSLRTRPAKFGEHTGRILQELGYAPENIQDLAERGVI
jgi:crotonobetainyl-CoA:carnitine CoA-transferase CaiB-like acyl-CoA transferase